MRMLLTPLILAVGDLSKNNWVQTGVIVFLCSNGYDVLLLCMHGFHVLINKTADFL